MCMTGLILHWASLLARAGGLSIGLFAILTCWRKLRRISSTRSTSMAEKYGTRAKLYPELRESSILTHSLTPASKPNGRFHHSV